MQLRLCVWQNLECLQKAPCPWETAWGQCASSVIQGCGLGCRRQVLYLGLQRSLLTPLRFLSLQGAAATTAQI